MQTKSSLHMKEKILAAINAKFLGLKLSKKRLDFIVKTIEEEVIDDESKIDAALTTFNKYNPLAEMAKQDADLRGLNKKVGELEAGGKPIKDKDETGGTKTDKEEVAEGNEPPAWAKAMMQELTSLKAEKAIITTREKLAKDLSDVPEIIWKERVMPTTEEAYTSFVEKVKTEWGEVAKADTSNALKNLGNQGGQRQQATAVKKDGKPDPTLATFLDKNKQPAPVGAAGFSVQGAKPPGATTAAVTK